MFCTNFSQTIDESPNSDVKMDISETTTSQESPILSPDFEPEPNLTAAEPTATTITDETSLTKGVVPKTMTKGKNTITATATSKTMGTSTGATTLDCLANRPSSLTALLKENNGDLDNRNSSIECDSLENSNNSNLSNRGGLTLTNSHPLMSPLRSANSDTDQVHFNYPDVVPESEPLRLANPMVAPKVVMTESPDDERDRSLDVLPSHVHGHTLTYTHTHTGVRQSDHDFLSSGDESEPDLSQYQAEVEPTFQSVSLVANSSTSKLRPDPSTNLGTRRKIPVSAELFADTDGGDDCSSVETVSNHSFDDDQLDDDFENYVGEPRNENNLISASVSSSLMDDMEANASSVGGLSAYMSKVSIVPGPSSNCLPQYSAVDEARDSRGWQKITLPDGKTRDIDMKVIEPYKRVLSHGGYLKAGGHNAIVVFSACYLPDRSRTDYHYVMENLFLYVVKTLEQLVTEDYVLIYLHGGSTRSNVPPFPWLKKCYQLLDRRLRKSLKNMFMVHPTFWLKSIVWMARPFIR